MTDLDTFPDLGETRFVRPRSLGDVVSATVRFLIDHAKPLALGQLTIAGPALVLFVAAQALTGTGEVFAPADPFGVDGEQILQQFGSTLLLPYLALLVFSVMCYGVAFGYVRAYREGRAEDDGPLWDDVRPVLWPITSVTLLALFLWMVIGGFLSFVMVAVLGTAMGALGGVVAVFGILALVAYLTPAWTMGYPARLFDTDRSGDALGRGWSLVHGRWWMAFGTLLVIGLIGMVLSIVAALPAGILDATREAAGAEPTAWTRALFSAFNLLGSMLFVTLVAVASAFLHGSLSADADDVEMMDDLSRLESDGEETPRQPYSTVTTAPRASPLPLGEGQGEGIPSTAGGPRTLTPTLSQREPEDAPSETRSASPEADAPTADVPPGSVRDADRPDDGFRGGGFRGGGFSS